ncbi:MAG: aminoacyl-tRNA deacylase [Clostridia bacterium]|nr:aminoacyl-tRNA deacylase [Clostridia bacterium]MCL6521378.1 aminoacyl-tRNA deacylase [Bacillota bacterium]
MSGVRTAALEVLERAGVTYELRAFEQVERTAGEAAAKVGWPLEQTFKTLLARAVPEPGGRGGAYFLACLPGDARLSLKKAARLLGLKRAEMAPEADLRRLTGYVRGACSPLGSRRPLPLLVDERALLYGRIMVSAGARGLQLLLDPRDLVRLTGATVADLVE